MGIKNAHALYFLKKIFAAILRYCPNIAGYQIWEDSANNFSQESVNNLLFAPVRELKMPMHFTFWKNIHGNT